MTLTLNRDITALHAEMTAWRHHIHQNPETAFEEVETAKYVTAQLESFGVDEIHTGLAKTGVVAVVKGARQGTGSIGLRADMDALDIHEQTNQPYASKVPGKMHACGHDGHTAMLLGAVKHLAATRDFAGTVYAIFQPAEENEGGAGVMVQEGLFDRFPMDAVYGVHNMPGFPLGQFKMCKGPMMASYDRFDLTVTGKGSHGAMPHQGVDPVVIAAQIVTNLQTIASRNMDPMKSLVVSVTQIHGGDAYNVIPEEVTLAGTVRSFVPEVQDLAEARIGQIARTIANAHNAEAHLVYRRGYPPTVNADANIDIAARVGATISADINTNLTPVMGSEDFAFMLQEKPGAYIMIGAGDGPPVHNPAYDFNDALLPVGATYFVNLVADQLGTA